MRQYDIHVVNLDPTRGSEIRETRPCVILTPDEMNAHLNTVQVAPLTSNPKPYPWRVPIVHRRKAGRVALDQIRTIDKARLVRRAGRVEAHAIADIKRVIHEMLVQ